MKTHYITKTWTENTGGGCFVDFIELEGGAVISVNDESVAIWPSINAFWDAVNGTDNACEMHHWMKRKD